MAQVANWWSELPGDSCVSDERHRILAGEATDFCGRTIGRSDDPWCDEAVTAMEQVLVDRAADVDAARRLPDYRQFVSYLGQCFVARAGGRWVELPPELNDTGPLAIYLPTENSLLPVESLVDAAVEERAARLWVTQLPVDNVQPL